MRYSGRQFCTIALLLLSALMLVACGDSDSRRPSVPPDTTPPTVPTGLTATATSGTTVQLSWTTSTDGETGVGGYRILRGTTRIGSTAAGTTTFIDSGLQDYTQYSYTVQAFDQATPAPNVSAASPSVSVTTPDVTPPTVPTNVLAVGQGSATLRLTWSAASDSGTGVGGYRIFKGVTQVATVAAGVTTWTDTGLLGKSNYSYTVRAFDGATPSPNESGASAVASGMTLADDTYISSASGIVRFTTEGNVSLVIRQEINSPSALAIDAAGNLYVGNVGDHSVRRYTPDGADALVSLSGAYCSPAAMAFDRSGDLFIACTDGYQTGAVLKLTPAGANSSFYSIPCCQQVVGLAIDSADNLYVTYLDSNAIYRIDGTGTAAVYASNPACTMSGRMTLDAADNLYVVCAGSSNLARIAPGGGVRLFSTGNTGPYPRAIAVDGSGTVYYSLANAGVYRWQLGSAQPPLQLAQSPAEDMVLNAVGDLFAIAASTNDIRRISSSGTVSVFAAAGLDGAAGLAIDGNGNLYVASSRNNTIRKYTAAGVGSLFASTGVSAPLGVACDLAGNVYVNNSGSNTVWKYAPDGSGSLFANVGVSGQGGIAVDASGNVFVTTRGYPSPGLLPALWKYTPTGAGSVLPGAINGDEPLALAVDSHGNVYASQPGNNGALFGGMVTKVLPNGTTVELRAPESYLLPLGLAFDSVGNLVASGFYIGASGLPPRLLHWIVAGAGGAGESYSLGVASKWIAIRR